MVLPQEYLEVQMEYAQDVSYKLGLPLYEALRTFTTFWRFIGNKGYEYKGEGFSAKAPLWIELQRRARENIGRRNPIILAAMQMNSENLQHANSDKKYFGCFRYDFYEFPPVHNTHPFKDDRDVIKIHFRNNDTDGIGPLKKEKVGQRLEDLGRMFGHIYKHYPQAKVVHGGSWLYNIYAYQRLFPASYTSQLKQEKPFPGTQGLWGQILTYDGQINVERVRLFRERYEAANTEEELLDAFPFKIKLARAIIQDFYDMYEIS